VIIQVIRFKEFIPGEVDVLVAFPHLPPGRERFTYRVSSSGGEWTVKSRKPA
jgi:hypothetical protein